MCGNDGYMDENEIERAVAGDLEGCWRGAYDQARVCVPCVEPVPDPSLRRARSL